MFSIGGGFRPMNSRELAKAGLTEDVAAVKIQSAFRGHKVRKNQPLIDKKIKTGHINMRTSASNDAIINSPTTVKKQQLTHMAALREGRKDEELTLVNAAD